MPGLFAIYGLVLYHFTHMNTATRKDLRSRDEKRLAAKADTRPRVTLSFYRYVQIADPEAFRNTLLTVWGELECRGRIYIAKEGINAQMDVLKDRFEEFDSFIQNSSELSGVPYKIAVEEGDLPSFFKLTVKVKDKIVADGLDDASFDVTNTGDYLTAAEINAYVEDPDAVVVDMRNAYESEIGHFEGAILPQVDTFREELAIAPELLKVHKNKKIALYCTGGIRCEKASAWLKHNGFSDVRHLKGGIIDYAHQVEAEGLPNKFRGSNFVFDERLAERVGTEVISHCHLCSTTKTDVYRHCQNQVCHELYLGCEACVEKRHGYCSYWCQLTDAIPSSYKKTYARWYNKLFRSRPFKKARLRSAH